MATAPPSPADPLQTAPGIAAHPTVGSYRLLGLLGEGGMGRVYLGQHLVSGQVFAVKILRPELTINHSAVRRFIAEARTVSRLGHPNIVRVVDVGEPAPALAQLYYVMEYLSGVDLKQVLQRGSMPLPRAVGIGLQIGDALQAVHDAGVIHRDLKPANILLLQRDDGAEVVKVLDFGLAKLESPESGTSTTSGHLLGTPAYMSPEQAAGERLDRRSDIYSLGVILYEMFTGRRPFAAASFGAYVVQHLTTRPIPPGDLSPVGAPLPEEANRIVLRCLEKNPDRRYTSAGELVADLRQLLPRRTAFPSMLLSTARSARRRSGWKVLALAAVGGLVAAVIIGLQWYTPSTSAISDQASLPPLSPAASPVTTPRAGRALSPLPPGRGAVASVVSSPAPRQEFQSSPKSTARPTTIQPPAPGVARETTLTRPHAPGRPPRRHPLLPSPSPSREPVATTPATQALAAPLKPEDQPPAAAAPRTTAAGATAVPDDQPTSAQPPGGTRAPRTKRPEKDLDHVTMDPF